MAMRPGPGTWTAWVAANAAGELVGLGLVFLAGFSLAARWGEPSGAAGALAFALAAVALGAVEGAVVGWAQAIVLARALPSVRRRAWTGATVAGAVLAWALGTIPSTLAAFQPASSEPPPEPGPLLGLALGAGLGAVAGLILALFQWLILRRASAAAAWWLPANALAWAVAMPWIFWLVGATVAEARSAKALALFLAGLGIAGALVGAVHGIFLVRRIVPAARR